MNMPDLISKIIASALGKMAWDSFKALFPSTDIYHDWISAVDSVDRWFSSTYGDRYGKRNDRFYDFNEIHELIYRSFFFGEELKEQDIAEMTKVFKCPTPASIVLEYIIKLKNELVSNQAYNWLFKEFEHQRLSERSATDLKELKTLFRDFIDKHRVTLNENRIINLNSYANFIRDEYLILVDSLWEPDQEKPRQIGLFDVYITRDDEADIIKTIEEDLTNENKKWIPITGDAGFGKTTLLFSLWDQFDKKKHETGIVPIFIRSSDLFEYETALRVYAETSPNRIEEVSTVSSFSDNQRMLLATIQKIFGENKQCIVFVDTLDAILTTKERIFQIRNLKDQLSDIGATQVISCRDFEFDALRHLPRRRFFRLKHYSDDRELPLVLDQYIDAFYQSRPFIWKNQQKADLLRAVASRVFENRDLAYICRNPLTLKMLFLIYHPDQIPQNVDIRLLYDEFWNAKVLCDANRRPLGKGDYLIPTSIAVQKNQLVSRIAFEMLVKGRLSLALSEIWPILNTYRNSIDLLKELLSENVLKQTGGLFSTEAGPATKTQGKIEFFHQTLYEYAAARFLRSLELEKQEKVIDWTLQYILDNPADTFRVPMVEQIALQFTSYQRKIMIFLLDSGSAIHAKLAVSIYSRFRTEERVNDYTIKLLSSPKSVQKFLLQSIRDFPSFRQDEVIHIFREIWTRGDHNLKENVLSVCVEVCNTQTVAVYKFLKDDAVWKYLLQFTDRSLLGGTISRLIVPILNQLMEIHPQWVFSKLQVILQILLDRKLLDVNLANVIDLLFAGLYSKRTIGTGNQAFSFESVIAMITPLMEERLFIEIKRKIGKIYAYLPETILQEKHDFLFETIASEHPQRAAYAANIILEIITCSKREELGDKYFNFLWDLFTKSIVEKNSTCIYVIAEIVFSHLAANGHRRLWDNLISLIQGTKDVATLHILALIFSKYERAISCHVTLWIEVLEEIDEALRAEHRTLSENIFKIIGNFYAIEPSKVKSFLLRKAKSFNDMISAMALKALTKVAVLNHHEVEFIQELSKRDNDEVKKALMPFLEHVFRNVEFENASEAKEAIALMMLSTAEPSNTPKTEVLKQCVPAILLLASSGIHHDKILEIAYKYGKSTKSDIRKSGSLILSTLLSATHNDAKRKTLIRLLFDLYEIGDLNNKTFMLRFLNESLIQYRSESDIDSVIKKCREIISTEADTSIFASICSILRTCANDVPDDVANLVVTMLCRIHEIKLTKEPVKHIQYLLVRIFISQMEVDNAHILEYLRPYLGKKNQVFEQFICEVVGKYYPHNHILPLSALMRRDDLLTVTKEKIHALVSKSTQSDRHLDALYEVADIKPLRN